MKRLFVILIFCFIYQFLFSQEKILNNFTIEDGLPSSHVYNGLQDRQGYIWFCTDKGVVKFDGEKSKVFTTEDGLSNNDIWNLFLDSQDRIWLYTFGNKIHYIQNDSVHAINAPANFDKITNIKEDPEKGLWFILGLRPFLYSNNKFVLEVPYYKKTESEANFLHYVNTSEDTTFYCSKTFPNNKPGHQFLHIKIGEGPITKIASITQNKITPFFITPYKNGVLSIENNSIYEIGVNHQKKLLYSTSDIYIKELVSFSDFNILATSKGQLILDKNFLPHPDFEFTKKMNINKVFEDRENNIWITTKDKGVFLWKRNQGSEIYKEDFKDNANLLCIEKDENETLWLGGSNDFLYYIDKDEKIKKIKLQLPPNSLDIGKEIKIIKSKNESLTLGLNIGLIQINKNKITSKTKKISPHFFLGKIPTKDFEFYNNNILATSGQAIVDINKSLKNNKVEYFFYKKTPIYQIALDNEKIWMGSHEGIVYLKNNELHEQHNPWSNLPISNIQTFKETDGIWVSTQTGVLYVIRKNETKKIFDFKTSINKILIENPTSIWAATSTGIYLLKEKNNEFQIEGFINNKNGLLSNEVNDFSIRKPFLYAATNKGLSKINLINFRQNKKPHFLQPIISEVLINNKKTSDKNPILKYNKNNLKFYFHSHSFSQFGNIEYEYRIPEINDNWERTLNRTANYTTLPHGAYTFQVRALIPNQTTSTTTSYSFEILPHWSNTWWFYTLCSLTFLFIVYFLYKNRIKKIEERELEKNKISHQFSELELQALQAQMNPHFIFNSLGAIQYFISTDQTLKAENYLSKFATLLRSYLEASRHKFISLQEEINLISNYIFIEQMRVNNKFTFELDTDPSCNLHSIHVPSFLIQPFIENAILHGLIPKEGEGMLIIRIKNNSRINSCVISIDDNGVGRTANTTAHPSKFKNHHKSRGLQLVQERIAVVNKIHNSYLGYEIIDKNNNQGTLVKITIPFDTEENE